MKAFNPSTSQWEDVYVKALDSFPVGVIVEYPTTDSAKLPTGYMFCDGSAISRTEYSELFSLIGTSFGAGDGSTTFNIPSKKGLVTVGINSSDTDFDTIGKTGGEKTHTMTINELVPHNHKVYAAQVKIGSNQTTVNTVTNDSASNWLTSATGNGQPFNVMQPYEVSNFIIKVKPTRVLASTVVNANNESTENAYSCDYANKAFGGKVLWTNPNPTANFDSQDITLSTGDYDFFEILYTTNDTTSMLNTGKIKKGFNTLLQAGVGSSSQGPYNFFRSITYTNDTTFNVGVGLEAYASQRPINAGVCIPLYVIGYKTGLFN